VLIDEVDMFLHPAWQQQVLGALQEAFPLLQFIVTTHSPQVLTTVAKENIRQLALMNTAPMPEYRLLARWPMRTVMHWPRL
jgi:predicted ATP-binding protein involved in virulence